MDFFGPRFMENLMDCDRSKLSTVSCLLMGTKAASLAFVWAAYQAACPLELICSGPQKSGNSQNMFLQIAHGLPQS